jgi:DNA helicase-2/ATP-dependent DNA helicase PcrA
MSTFVPTPEQRAILGHDPEQHARVLAGPGTGKSATLVALVGELLARKRAPRVRLLTFTRAATAELAKKVSEHPAAAVERPSTIHSFAISVLLRNPGTGDLPRPLRIADDWEYHNIIRPTLARRVGVVQKRLDRLVRELAANWESLRPERDPVIDKEERARFLGAWKEHRAIYGYTLLAERPYALRGTLRDHPDLKGVNYDLLVVDEYQDLNACDLDVLKLIAARGCSVIGAGDDEQSICSFRKAAPEGILRFPQDYPGAADYSLSVTQRCGSKIVGWASYVIQGDPDRDPTRPQLASAKGSPPGEVALLSFTGEVGEARGIGALVENLVEREGVAPSDILVLFRSDYGGGFSKPIKRELVKREIPVSDPDSVERLLEDPSNRRVLEMCRLLGYREDSIAWASLLQLTAGIGDQFVAQIYERARRRRSQFGRALLDAYSQGFPETPVASSRRARAMMETVLQWLDDHRPPEDMPAAGWGKWIVEITGDEVVPSPSEEFADLLLELDALAEAEQDLGRYLGQIQPLGKDLAMAHREGVRIMTMNGAKGLTVRAAIVAALEDGIMPRPDCDLGEERRLLYVAMTRPREYLYGTWARRRKGPTARAGSPKVGELRQHSGFLDGGAVESQDGANYIGRRWPRTSS